MARTRYSYIGLSVLLTLLIPIPVYSDAPPQIIEQRRLQNERNSPKNRRGETQVSPDTKPDGEQTINNGSSRNIEEGDSTPSGTSSVQKQTGNQGQRNPSSRGLTREATQGITNSSSGVSSETTDTGTPSSITSESNTVPSGSNSNLGESGRTGESGSNSNLGESGRTGESGNNSNSGGIVTSPSGKTEDNPVRSSNLNLENQRNTPAVVSTEGSSNILSYFIKNPFLFWLFWLLPLVLHGLLLWWFRKQRSSLATRQELEDRINVDNSKKLEQQINQYIDQIFEQKIQNYIPLITHNLVNNNDELNQYIEEYLQQFVTNNTKIRNEIVSFVINSTEINNKISTIYRDVDIKIENIRNEWNQTFITLVRQYVDELIAIIGNRESFNIQIANIINVKVDELLNQIWRIRNELTVFINNSDRNLYEWTLGELMVIKGCLTDRQALVEQLATFSSELRVKLDNTTCVDINTFQPFKLISTTQQLPGDK